MFRTKSLWATTTATALTATTASSRVASRELTATSSHCRRRHRPLRLRSPHRRQPPSFQSLTIAARTSYIASPRSTAPAASREATQTSTLIQSPPLTQRHRPRWARALRRFSMASPRSHWAATSPRTTSACCRRQKQSASCDEEQWAPNLFPKKTQPRMLRK